MLGLDVLRVTSVGKGDGAVTIEVDTIDAFAWSGVAAPRARIGCGPMSVIWSASVGRSTPQLDSTVAFPRAVLWTEPIEFLDAQVVLTRWTGAEACRRVGELARPASQVADEFGVCWETMMNAVVEHGMPLVDDQAGSAKSASLV